MTPQGRLIGQGAEAEVFATEDGMALKLMRSAVDADRLAREVVALRAAAEAGVRVPRLARQVELDGRPGVVMQRIEGIDLLTLIGRRPWSVFSAGAMTGRVHAQINAAPAPDGLPSVKDAVGSTLDRLLNAAPSAEVDWAARVLRNLPDGDRLCHGDFHPGQMMVEAGEAVALDWGSAKRGDPLFDHAVTRVALSLGAPPPGSSLPLRALATIGRGILVASYVRAYRRAAVPPVDARRVLAWEVVALAARLSINQPAEIARLRARLAKLFARRKANGLPP